MFDKACFLIRVSSLILLLLLLFFAADNISTVILKIKSTAVAETILPQLNAIMPVHVIIRKMKEKQYQEVADTLRHAGEWDNLRVAISSEFLSVGGEYSEIVFSKAADFYPAFRISTSQSKRLEALTDGLYFIVCVTMAVVIFIMYVYQSSDIILLIYLFLFLTGALWLSLPMNQLVFSDLYSEEKREDLHWQELEIEEGGLRLQWAGTAPFSYLYKNNPQRENYFLQYNPQANWRKSGTDFLLCRYDFILDIIRRVQLLARWILFFWAVVWLYILYQVARRLLPVE